MKEDRTYKLFIRPMTSISVGLILFFLVTINVSANGEFIERHDSVDSANVELIDPPESVPVPWNTTVWFNITGLLTIELNMQIRPVTVYLGGVQSGSMEMAITPNEFTFSGSGRFEETFTVEVRLFPRNDEHPYDDIVHVGVQGGYRIYPGLISTHIDEDYREIPVPIIFPENNTLNQTGDSNTGLFDNIPIPIIIIIPIILIAVFVIVGFWYFKKRKK